MSACSLGEGGPAGAGTPPVVLTVAGSDSGGGAGIQADLRTFAALQVIGATAVTALTAQNTAGVQGIRVTPADFVAAQLDSVLDDLEVVATKTGMLASAAIVELVAGRAEQGRLPNLVVDPVMVSSSGNRLLEGGAEDAYAELLVPRARVVTPNLREASILCGRDVSSVDDMEAAARSIHATGPDYVLVKGGDLGGTTSPDVLFDGRRALLLGSDRVRTGNDHGTGCTLSAAIAANLARGLGVEDAVTSAKSFVTRAVCGAAGWRVGAGHGPIDQPGAGLSSQA